MMLPGVLCAMAAAVGLGTLLSQIQLHCMSRCPMVWSAMAGRWARSDRNGCWQASQGAVRTPSLRCVQFMPMNGEDVD